MGDVKLPELPEPTTFWPYEPPDRTTFTADQMREFAREAVLAERAEWQADAERYRWLREESELIASSIGCGIGITSGPKHPSDMRLLDERIDAILASRKG
jgi:hypothetical protein